MLAVMLTRCGGSKIFLSSSRCYQEKDGLRERDSEYFLLFPLLFMPNISFFTGVILFQIAVVLQLIKGSEEL